MPYIPIRVDESRFVFDVSGTEGVWLEKRAHNGYERVTKGRIVGYATDFTEVVFD